MNESSFQFFSNIVLFISHFTFKLRKLVPIAPFDTW
jgi:hypothetical protein